MKLKSRGLRFSPLFFIGTLIILLILFPSAMLVVELFKPATDSWDHIKEFLLGKYIINSLILIFSVASITAVVGTFFSYSLSKYNFKFSKTINMLLYIPLAIPVYIGGYIYGGFFGNFGTLDRILLKMGFGIARIDVYSMKGAIFVFSLFLMPYVVLITKSFFHRFPASYIETSKLLGRSNIETFFKVVLPMSRGSIIGATVLVILEVLNEYGLVKYFGIPTFSTAIYTTWFGLGDIQSAIRLASYLMIIVFSILLIENISRRNIRVSNSRTLTRRSKKENPSTILKVVFYTVYSIYIIFSVIIPLLQLIYWSTLANSDIIKRDFYPLVSNTLTVAVIVTILVIVSGIIIGNYKRLSENKISKLYSKIVILGYSIPASIIAVTVLLTFISIDRFLKPLYAVFELKSLFLTSSIVLLIFALTIRFMAIGFNSIESGFNKMGKKYYEASRVLGKSAFVTFFKVDLPILKPAIISALILTFVDILKELPLTLILRPFNFDTLATKVFTYASDEMIHEASIYALLIIGVSIVMLIILQMIQKEKIND